VYLPRKVLVHYSAHKNFKYNMYKCITPRSMFNIYLFIEILRNIFLFIVWKCKLSFRKVKSNNINFFTHYLLFCNNFKLSMKKKLFLKTYLFFKIMISIYYYRYKITLYIIIGGWIYFMSCTYSVNTSSNQVFRTPVSCNIL